MYAVVSLQWHQYIVQQWDTITVDRYDVSAWESFTIDSVLMVFSEDASQVAIGAPLVSGASVKMTVLDHKKWDKLRVLKFQWKKRYQRIKGFRPYQTVLSIDSVIYG